LFPEVFLLFLALFVPGAPSKIFSWGRLFSLTFLHAQEALRSLVSRRSAPLPLGHSRKSHPGSGRARVNGLPPSLSLQLYFNNICFLCWRIYACDQIPSGSPSPSDVSFLPFPQVRYIVQYPTSDCASFGRLSRFLPFGLPSPIPGFACPPCPGTNPFCTPHSRRHEHPTSVFLFGPLAPPSSRSLRFASRFAQNLFPHL